MPVGGVCQQVGQYGAQQGEGDLLSIQAEDAVEQLHHPIGPLLSGLLQQLLQEDATLMTRKYFIVCLSLSCIGVN